MYTNGTMGANGGATLALQMAMNLHKSLHATFCESLANELHRDVCQQLTAAKLELDLMALDRSEDEALDRARAALSESMKGIRELMESLACERG